MPLFFSPKCFPTSKKKFPYENEGRWIHNKQVKPQVLCVIATCCRQQRWGLISSCHRSWGPLGKQHQTMCLLTSEPGKPNAWQTQCPAEVGVVLGKVSYLLGPWAPCSCVKAREAGSTSYAAPFCVTLASIISVDPLSSGIRRNASKRLLCYLSLVEDEPCVKPHVALCYFCPSTTTEYKICVHFLKIQLGI